LNTFFEIFLDNIIFAYIFRLKNDISLMWIIQEGAQVKEEKAESILNTAKKMFGRYGLQKTTLDEIARMARVAKATIYNYFGSKDRVYLEVLRREANEIVEKISFSVSQEALPGDKVVAFARARFQYMRQAINILNLDRDGIEKVLPKAESIRSELFEREVDIICSILEEGVEKGVFCLNNVPLAASAIGHALKGFELNWLVQESEERIEHHLDELINIIFYGLMSEKRGGVNE
jgi:AcrR family transcriptional regulator